MGSPSRNSGASARPVDAPEGIEAEATEPSSNSQVQEMVTRLLRLPERPAASGFGGATQAQVPLQNPQG